MAAERGWNHKLSPWLLRDTFENGTWWFSVAVCCLTHGALIIEEDRISLQWCFWTQPRVVHVCTVPCAQPWCHQLCQTSYELTPRGFSEMTKKPACHEYHESCLLQRTRFSASSGQHAWHPCRAGGIANLENFSGARNSVFFWGRLPAARSGFETTGQG